jgi:hypothetical protein
MSNVKWEGIKGKPLIVTANAFEIVRLPQKPFFQFDGTYLLLAFEDSADCLLR